MEDNKNRLLMIGFPPGSVNEILSDLLDPEDLTLFVEWQEQIYREQCAKFLDEVMD